MCGRFTLHIEPDDLVRTYGRFHWAVRPEQRYNIAPTQLVVVVAGDESPEVRTMRWGLVPRWADDIAIGNRMINARAETLAQKPAFKKLFARQRCLILADGFYEWRSEGKNAPKTPFYIRMKDGRPFAFAGLWDRWTDADGVHLDSCTIITCEANSLVGQLHDRMPVILSEQDYDTWLDPTINDTHVLTALLQPYDPDDMQAHQVSRTVNNPAHEQPGCIDPV